MTRRTATVAVDNDGWRKDVTLRFEYNGPERDGQPQHRIVTDNYYYADNPTTGLPAVFLPGETLPDWALSDKDRTKLGDPPTV